ncbi:MAG: GPW/gp25 family protein [Pseudomonadota bacterium]
MTKRQGPDGSKTRGDSWSFPSSFPSRDQNPKLLEDVTESLNILLLTRPGERVMHPDYGCNFLSIANTSPADQVEEAMRVDIERAILFFEPRVYLTGVAVDLSKISTGFVAITLDFTLVETQSHHSVDLVFYPREGTLMQGDG